VILEEQNKRARLRREENVFFSFWTSMFEIVLQIIDTLVKNRGENAKGRFVLASSTHKKT